MAGDHSEYIDDYCRDNYGHTNWGYLDTYTKEELTKAEQQAKEMEMEQKELDYSDGYKDGYARATDLAIDKLKELIPRINDNTSISFQNTTTNTTTGYPKGATITDLK